MKKCPKCQFEFNDEFKFCPKCGNKYIDFVEGDFDNSGYSGSGFNYGNNNPNNQQVPQPTNNGINYGRSNQSTNNGINYGRSNDQVRSNYPTPTNPVQYHSTHPQKPKSNPWTVLAVCIGIFIVLGIILSGLDNSGSSDRSTTTSVEDDNSVTRSMTEADSADTSSDKNDSSPVESKKNNYPTISTGVYIVGEDIDEGTYYFHVVSGLGELLVYKSYDDYKADDSGYDAMASFDLKAADASSGLTNDDVYAEYVSGIILENGQCISIKKGAVVEYATSLEDYGVSGVITPGIYVVGKNLESGKYTLNAISGMGEVCVFSSYESFKESSSSYDAEESYDIKAPDASVGLTNEDVYSNSINNLRLDDGQCVYVRKGLTLSYKDDYSLTDNSAASEAQPEAETKEAPVDEKVEETKEDDNSSKSSKGYEAIYDEYAKKIKDATPGLIQEYKNEAAKNNNGLEGLASISNAKVEKLANIANEGVEKMADYMYKKGSGKYEEYSDWSGKLYEVYMDEAGKITEEYMNSAMN